VDDPRGDEQQHPRERRQRHIFEHRRGRYQQRDRCRGAETSGLRAARRGGDGRGSRRARVHGKRADNSRRDAAGTHPEKVAAHLDVVAALLRKRTRRGRRLRYHDQRDDAGDRRHTTKRRPR
jgi:hypothetical protein